MATADRIHVWKLGLGLLTLAIGWSSWWTLGYDDVLFGQHEGESSGRFLGWGAGIYLWSAALCSGPAAAALNYAWLRHQPMTTSDATPNIRA